MQNAYMREVAHIVETFPIKGLDQQQMEAISRLRYITHEVLRDQVSGAVVTAANSPTEIGKRARGKEKVRRKSMTKRRRKDDLMPYQGDSEDDQSQFCSATVMVDQMRLPDAETEIDQFALCHGPEDETVHMDDASHEVKIDSQFYDAVADINDSKLSDSVNKINDSQPCDSNFNGTQLCDANINDAQAVDVRIHDPHSATLNTDSLQPTHADANGDDMQHGNCAKDVYDPHLHDPNTQIGDYEQHHHIHNGNDGLASQEVAEGVPQPSLGSAEGVADQISCTFVVETGDVM